MIIKFLKVLVSPMKIENGSKWELIIPADSDKDANLFIKLNKKGNKLSVNNSNTLGISNECLKRWIIDGIVQTE